VEILNEQFRYDIKYKELNIGYLLYILHTSLNYIKIFYRYRIKYDESTKYSYLCNNLDSSERIDLLSGDFRYKAMLKRDIKNTQDNNEICRIDYEICDFSNEYMIEISTIFSKILTKLLKRYPNIIDHSDNDFNELLFNIIIGNNLERHICEYDIDTEIGIILIQAILNSKKCNIDAKYIDYEYKKLVSITCAAYTIIEDYEYEHLCSFIREYQIDSDLSDDDKREKIKQNSNNLKKLRYKVVNKILKRDV
jgi:hypothetical protein